jgi:hypothetical protein
VSDLDGVDMPEGDAERVEGGLTAIESALETVVDNDVVDPVRRIDAASLGRPARAEAGLGALLALPLGKFELMLMRAAS